MRKWILVGSILAEAFDAQGMFLGVAGPRCVGRRMGMIAAIATIRRRTISPTRPNCNTPRALRLNTSTTTKWSPCIPRGPVRRRRPVLVRPVRHSRPEGYDGVQRITVPIRRLAALSTTQLPHLELLDALENLVAVSDIEMVNSPGVNQRFAAGKIAQIGHGAGVNLELVLELETDVVMTVASAQSQYNAHPVLQQAGVAVAINAEYTEPSLLGRTEWLKFTAAFFNAEALAEKRFADIVAQYQQYAALVRGVPTDQRPAVFGGSLWRDTWHVAGGKSYAAQLVSAAGGAYLWADDDSGGSLPLDFEAVYEKAHAADVWLTMRNEWHSLAEVQTADERYAAFAAFNSGRVYNANARLNAHGGNDYWEAGLVEPHIVLADFIKILHPDLLPDHALKFYKKLD